VNNDFFQQVLTFSQKNYENFGKLCFQIKNLTKFAKILEFFFKNLISQNGKKKP